MPRYGQDGMHVLNVAEKNDAAKCLSQIMSNGRSNRVKELKFTLHLCISYFTPAPVVTLPFLLLTERRIFKV